MQKLKDGWIYCFLNTNNEYKIGSSLYKPEKQFEFAKLVKNYKLKELQLQNFIEDNKFNKSLDKIKNLFAIIDGEWFIIDKPFHLDNNIPDNEYYFSIDELRQMNNKDLKIICDSYGIEYNLYWENIATIEKILIIQVYTNPKINYEISNRFDVVLQKYGIIFNNLTTFDEVREERNKLYNFISLINDYFFKDGQKIRHRIYDDDAWEGFYNLERKEILYENNYYNFETFARAHEQSSPNGNKMRCILGKECEYQLDNGIWLPINEHRIYFNNKSEYNLIKKIKERILNVDDFDIPFPNFKNEQKIRYFKSNQILYGTYYKEVNCVIVNNIIYSSIRIFLHHCNEKLINTQYRWSDIEYEIHSNEFKSLLQFVEN